MKISIIGKSKGWENAPKTEAWGVNDLCLRRDVDIVFNMHSQAAPDNKKRNDKINEYVNKKKVPLVCLEKIESVPSSIRYPIEKMHTDYFTNSISYMIAFAVYLGFRQIDLYGCAILADEEYLHQKPNIEYWIGYALGSGISVNVHEPTSLLKSISGVYGYNRVQTEVPHN